MISVDVLHFKDPDPQHCFLYFIEEGVGCLVYPSLKVWGPGVEERLVGSTLHIKLGLFLPRLVSRGV